MAKEKKEKINYRPLIEEKENALKENAIHYKIQGRMIWAFPETKEEEMKLGDLGFFHSNNDENSYGWDPAGIYVGQQQEREPLTDEERNAIFGTRKDITFTEEEKQNASYSYYPEDDLVGFNPNEEELTEEDLQNLADTEEQRHRETIERESQYFSASFAPEEMEGAEKNENFNDMVRKDLVVSDSFGEAKANIALDNIKDSTILTLSGVISAENMKDIISQLAITNYNIKTVCITGANDNGFTFVDRNALKMLCDSVPGICNLRIRDGENIVYENTENSDSVIWSELKDLRHIKIEGAFPPPTNNLGAFEGLSNIKTCVWTPSSDYSDAMSKYTVPENAFKESSLKVFVNNSLCDVHYGKACFAQVRTKEEGESDKAYQDFVVAHRYDHRDRIKALSTYDLEILKSNVNYTELQKTASSLFEDADKEIEKYKESDLTDEVKEKNIREINRGKAYLTEKLSSFSHFASEPEKVINNASGVCNIVDESPVVAEDFAFTNNRVSFYQGANLKEAVYNLDKDCHQILMDMSEKIKDFENRQLGPDSIILTEREKKALFETKELLKANEKNAEPVYGSRPENFNTVWKISDLLDQDKTNALYQAFFGSVSSEMTNDSQARFEAVRKSIEPLKNCFSPFKKDNVPYFDNAVSGPVVFSGKDGFFGEHSFENTNVKGMYVSNLACYNSQSGLDQNISKLIEKYKGQGDMQSVENLLSFAALMHSKEEAKCPVVDRYAFSGNTLYNCYEDATGLGFSKAHEAEESGVVASKAPDMTGLEILQNRYLFSGHPIRKLEEESPYLYWSVIRAKDAVNNYFHNLSANYRRMTIPESAFWTVFAAGKLTALTMKFGYQKADSALSRHFYNVQTNDAAKLKEAIDYLKKENENLGDRQNELTIQKDKNASTLNVLVSSGEDLKVNKEKIQAEISSHIDSINENEKKKASLENEKNNLEKRVNNMENRILDFQKTLTPAEYEAFKELVEKRTRDKLEKESAIKQEKVSYENLKANSHNPNINKAREKLRRIDRIKNELKEVNDTLAALETEGKAHMQTLEVNRMQLEEVGLKIDENNKYIEALNEINRDSEKELDEIKTKLDKNAKTLDKSEASLSQKEKIIKTTQEHIAVYQNIAANKLKSTVKDHRPSGQMRKISEDRLEKHLEEKFVQRSIIKRERDAERKRSFEK